MCKQFQVGKRYQHNLNGQLGEIAECLFTYESKGRQFGVLRFTDGSANQFSTDWWDIYLPPPRTGKGYMVIRDEGRGPFLQTNEKDVKYWKERKADGRDIQIFPVEWKEIR